MNFYGRTVLVIGGAGYIGTVLTPLLLDAGANVRVLDQLLYQNGFALQHLLDRPGMKFIYGDYCDQAVFRRAAAGVTDLVLLAALVGDPICKKYPELAVRINRDAAFDVITALDDLSIQRFVFTSTCSNYGLQDPHLLATEEADLHPQSLYATSKVAVEKRLLEEAGKSLFCGTALRLATAYGLSPRMRFDLTVSQFAHALATGERLSVYDADTWRPYCHVRDISRAIICVLTQPPATVRAQVFNVGDDSQQFTKRMIVDEIAKQLDSIQVEYLAGDTDPRNYRVSFRKITQQLGFKCSLTVQQYLPLLIHSVRNGVFPNIHSDSRYGNYFIVPGQER